MITPRPRALPVLACRAACTAASFSSGARPARTSWIPAASATRFALTALSPAQRRSASSLLFAACALLALRLLTSNGERMCKNGLAVRLRSHGFPPKDAPCGPRDQTPGVRSPKQRDASFRLCNCHGRSDPCSQRYLLSRYPQTFMRSASKRLPTGIITHISSPEDR